MNPKTGKNFILKNGKLFFYKDLNFKSLFIKPIIKLELNNNQLLNSLLK